MSLDFDAVSGELLNIADAGPSDILGPFTIHAWIKPDSVTSVRRIVAKWGSSTAERQYMLQLNVAKVDGRSGGTTNNDNITGPTSVSANVWSAVAYRRSTSGVGGEHGIWLNGADEGHEATATGNNNSAAPVRIATDNIDSNHFDGKIAEVAIWDAYLTPAEIGALARGIAAVQIRRQNLVGYWPLFGLADPEADYTGGGNATYGGSPTRFAHAPVARF